MSISEDDLLKSGSSTDAVRIPDDHGGGFMASVEVNHQLHCLVSCYNWHLCTFFDIILISHEQNFLRKSTFLNYPYYEDKAAEYKDTPSIVRIHLGLSMPRILSCGRYYDVHRFDRSLR